MKKHLLVLTLIISVIVLGILVSCNNNVPAEVKNDINDNAVPYATEEELLFLLENNENIVDYRIARTLGLIEMQNFLESCNWSFSATLSLTPVVIYSADETPKYYEFHVIDNNADVGYVTCIANKTLGDPIQYISRDRKNYNLDENTTKSIKSSTSKVYDYGYPNTDILTDSQVKLIKQTKSIEKTEEEMLDEWANSFTEEELLELGVTREDIKEAYYQNQNEEKERLENLWALIDEAKKDILDTPDEMIINTNSVVQKSPIYYDTEVFVLKDWGNPKDVLSFEYGACGPTALLQAMKGFLQNTDIKHLV